MPRKPTEPISEDETAHRRSFYRAEYDDTGRLSRFAKFLDDELEWEDEYHYGENGKLRRRVIHKNDGSKAEEEYDQRGHRIT